MIIEKKSKKNSTKQQFHHMNSLSLSKNKLNIELNKTFNPFKREKKQDSLHLSHLETDVKKKNEIKENNKINITNNNSYKPKRSFTINMQSEKINLKSIENMTPKAKMNINFLPTILEKKSEKEKNDIIEKESSSKIKFDFNYKPENTFSSNNSLEKYLNFRKQKKKEKPIKLRKELFDKSALNISSNKKEIDNSIIKNQFFLEKIIKKKDKKKIKNKSFSNRTPKNEFLGKLKRLNLDTPFVKDKIIFSKGETEKLLNYQFYQSSYNACCDVNKYSSINNKCIKTNYDNNWNLVRQYTNEKRKKNQNMMKEDYQ